MAKASFSDLTPTFFLQTFVLELMHAAEQEGHCHNEQLIEHIARTAGRFFEETYRDENDKQGPLSRENYVDVILGLKNNIGGNFSLASSDQDCIRVVNNRCPFGEGVTNFPELCRMTSSVFGGIAARNFGYAKVEIKKAIARHDHGCEVCIYPDPAIAKDRPGLEYTNCDLSQAKQDMDHLQARIEERMHQIWRMSAKQKATRRDAPVIVAKSPGMQKVLKSIEVIAPTLATVLIQGETGVGKELIARAMHAMSKRCQKPFVAINCGAIPENLIESVLFGHEKGAFTGAVEVHQGYFERAEAGTLFLDEVDSLSTAAQTRLLRVLQEGELERVGGKQTLSVDVRMIAATNQNLEKLVKRNQFRSDLYYRINVVRLMIPPLAERTEDLSYLVNLILKRLNKKYDKDVETVSRKVMKQIRTYSWPGNVRELENTLERCILFSNGNELTELDLAIDSVEEKQAGGWKAHKAQVLTKAEHSFLDRSLRSYEGDVKKVAESMQITPRAVYDKLKKHHINPSSYREERS